MDPQAALELLNTKLAEHGLAARGWTGDLDSAVGRFGSCSHRRKRISLSRHLVAANRDEETLDTILHEIAHALTEPGEAHGAEWQRVAARLGARPDRTAPPGETTGVDGSWFLVHEGTGEVLRTYHRRPRRMDVAGSWIRGRRRETEGRLRIVSAAELTRLHDRIHGEGEARGPFDEAFVAGLETEITRAIRAICERRGLQVESEGGSYAPWVCRLGFAIRPAGQDGDEGERAEFAIHAHLFDLSVDDYGRPFTTRQGDSFVLVGLAPQNRKYPVIGRDEEGRLFKFGTDVLTELR
jgi:hypothetical protein